MVRTRCHTHKHTPYYLVWKSQILYKHSLNTFSPKMSSFLMFFRFILASKLFRTYTSFSCELFINSIRALCMNYVFNILFSHHPYWFDLICGGLDFVCCIYGGECDVHKALTFLLKQKKNLLKNFYAQVSDNTLFMRYFVVIGWWSR